MAWPDAVTVQRVCARLRTAPLPLLRENVPTHHAAQFAMPRVFHGTRAGAGVPFGARLGGAVAVNMSLSVPRFIPARAGNTRRTNRPRSRSTVHPRAGGEHHEETYGMEVTNGSSPRGRGTLDAPLLRGPRRRFIPARAGNTGTNCGREYTMQARRITDPHRSNAPLAGAVCASFASPIGLPIRGGIPST